MSSTDRQNKLIVAEDWKKIYQSFKNAEFQSYDFDNLRRTMITYLRENYPEDFNDYIESSEYLALIDLIAFLGQNLAFRFDLNARDNFLELAERRESILRLARLLSYNPKRNQAANGLLKFTSVATSENIIDSNGRNISNQTITWNDPTNTNWYEQFVKVINAALPETIQFGKPSDSATISGVKCDQYRFNATNTEVPVYSFNKSIDGRDTVFEIVSTVFKDSNKIYEEAPALGNNLAFVYRDDGRGAASSNTGFFLHFRQGTLQSGQFNLTRPGPNEKVDLDAVNINNEDVWLYGIDANGLETEQWTKVDAVEGNNIIYNNLEKGIKKIFSVLSRSADRVSLIFADGTFGDLPQGTFKVYYRTSNGLSYTINPTDITGVTIDVPYVSRTGKQETLRVALALKYSVTNAAETESSDAIKVNAPSTYYTQGRMITGEDYNVLPLSVDQEIIKAHAVNRTSSGISRYFDLKDASGKYSYTNLLGTDGVIYKERFLQKTSFTAATRTDIDNVIVNIVQPIFKSSQVKNFYLEAFSGINLGSSAAAFEQVTTATNLSTGYIKGTTSNTPKKVGTLTVSNLKYLVPNAMVRFIPPENSVFGPNNDILPNTTTIKGTKEYIWAKVVNVISDGTANNTGVLASGKGPVSFNEVIPSNAKLDIVIPKFTSVIDDTVKNKISDLIFANKNFGLRYEQETTSWKIILEVNLDKKSPFNIGNAGSVSNAQQDASWIVLFETNGEQYTVTSRALRYIFESKQEVRFFFDTNDKVYDSNTGKIIRDKITILGLNSAPNSDAPIVREFDWQIVEDYKGADGYIDTRKISISFTDTDEDGIIDDPDLFEEIVDTKTNPTQKVVFQKRQTNLDGITDYYYFSNEDETIKVFETQDDIDTSTLSAGDLVYIIDENLVKQYISVAGNEFIISSEYKGYFGRDNIKFQYIHAADGSVRLDPSSTNIIDVYLLTKTYDTDYRRWVAGSLATKPLPLSSDDLFVNFGGRINKVKAISDEVIYHSVKYKNLFGSLSDTSLQATFKVTKNSNLVISDSDVKVGVINAITEFFAIENWSFGETFYFGELSAYIIKKMSPYIVNIIITPKQTTLAFGSLYEIKSNADEIFISSATVDDVEIISEITAAKLNVTGNVLTSVTSNNTSINSR